MVTFKISANFVVEATRNILQKSELVCRNTFHTWVIEPDIAGCMPESGRLGSFHAENTYFGDVCPEIW